MTDPPAGLPESRLYRYIGPPELLDLAQSGRAGAEITSTSELEAWLDARDPAELDEPFTFTVNMAGTLQLASRRSEHVACAAGRPVLAAGRSASPGNRMGGW